MPASRTGGANVTRNTPALDATIKWLEQVGGVHGLDLGGISAESQIKIAHGLEAHGRPVTKVNPYMVARMVQRAQRWLAATGRRRSTRSGT